MEAQLLRYLIQNTGHPVSRKAILEDVWDLHEDTDTRAIDNFIVRLRRYIEEEPAKPRYLLTVRGIGYRFMPHPTVKNPKLKATLFEPRGPPATEAGVLALRATPSLDFCTLSAS